MSDGPRAVAPGAARQPLPEEAVERVRQRAEAGVRVGHDRLRGRERRARLEPPGERVGLDAEPDARRPERVDLRLGEEVAGVDEAEPVGLAVRLVRGGAAQGEERVVLGARRAARARGGLAAGHEAALDDVALARPRAGQAEQDPVGIGQVHSEAHRAAQLRRRAPDVPDGGAPGDDRPVAEDREPQVHLDGRRLVDEGHLERVGLAVVLDIGRRQTARGPACRQGSGARDSAGSAPSSRRPRGHERRHPEVAGPARRIGQRDRLTDPVREPVERVRPEVPVRPTERQRSAQVQVAERRRPRRRAGRG